MTDTNKLLIVGGVAAALAVGYYFFVKKPEVDAATTNQTQNASAEKKSVFDLVEDGVEGVIDDTVYFVQQGISKVQLAAEGLASNIPSEEEKQNWASNSVMNADKKSWASNLTKEDRKARISSGWLDTFIGNFLDSNSSIVNSVDEPSGNAPAGTEAKWASNKTKDEIAQNTNQFKFLETAWSKVTGTVKDLVGTAETNVNNVSNMLNPMPLPAIAGRSVMESVYDPNFSAVSDALNLKVTSKVEEPADASAQYVSLLAASPTATRTLPPLVTSNAKVKPEDRVGAGGVVRRSESQPTGGKISGYGTGRPSSPVKTSIGRSKK